MVDNASTVASLAVCRRCGHEAERKFKVGPLGLQQYRCAQCGHTSTHPLSRGWRAFWWVCAITTTIGCVVLNVTFARGYSWIPGGLGLVAFIALFVDVGVRHRVGLTAPTRSSSHEPDGTGEHDLEASPKVLRRSPGVHPAYVAILTSVAVCAVLASAIGAVIVAGLNNGYDVDVVVQSEQSPSPTFDGTFDLESGDAICGDGADYYGCIEAHRAMYNAVCTGGGGWRSYLPSDTLTSSARATCDQLLGFVTSGQEQLEGCGYGCTTQVEADGTWGWKYLHPVPRQAVKNNDVQPAITYTDRCWFSFGPLELGRCE